MFGEIRERERERERKRGKHKGYVGWVFGTLPDHVWLGHNIAQRNQHKSKGEKHKKSL